MPKFTDRVLKAFTLRPGQKDRLMFDAECPGLGVRVTAKGTKVFLVQWTDRATGRKVREPLAPWGSITLEAAREAARIKIGEASKGVDHAAERKRKREADETARAEQVFTLDTLIASWSDLHLANRRPRYREEAQRALRFAFAEHLKKPAAKLTKAAVVEILDGMAQAGRAATVTKTIAFGRACYTWALKRGRVPASPFDALPIAAVTTERDRVLTDQEVAEIWEAAGTLGYPFGPFYRLALLTLQRREEVAGMLWSEVSDDRALWSIGADRMKNSRAHDVHLPPPARTLLNELPRFPVPEAASRAIKGGKGNAGKSGSSTEPRRTDLVFTTNRKAPISGYSKGKAQLDAAIMKARMEAAKKAGGKAAPLVPWRLHDFRRTGVSRLAALGFDSIVADKLLAHKPAKLKGVASVYQRHDFAAERRKALEAWAAHVTGAKAGGNVVEMRRA